MGDQELRRLERSAQQGALHDRVRLLLEQVRLGECSRDRLFSLARLGDPAAQMALEDAAPARMGFLAAVEELMAWATSEPSNPQEEARRVFGILARLLQEAVSIPAISPEESVVEVADVGPDEWQQVYRRAGALPVNHYSVVFDALEDPPSAPVTGDVADDLADVFRDLEVGRRLHAAGEYVEAAWSWRFSFESHWGRHALGAMRALYACLGHG